MKTIPLTQGKVALVDDEDFEYLSQFKWAAHKTGPNLYADRYSAINGHGGRIQMHREIMCFPKGMEIDHIDHNGLNNQKNNLRVCTRKQNAANTKSYGKSKYRGVFIDRDKYIRAAIKIQDKYTYLGSFKTEIDAAMAYDKMAKKYYGEFANLNFKD